MILVAVLYLEMTLHSITANFLAANDAMAESRRTIKIAF